MLGTGPNGPVKVHVTSDGSTNKSARNDMSGTEGYGRVCRWVYRGKEKKISETIGSFEASESIISFSFQLATLLACLGRCFSCFQLKWVQHVHNFSSYIHDTRSVILFGYSLP